MFDTSVQTSLVPRNVNKKCLKFVKHTEIFPFAELLLSHLHLKQVIHEYEFIFYSYMKGPCTSGSELAENLMEHLKRKSKEHQTKLPVALIPIVVNVRERAL